jgi:phosphatidylglycerol:prolipoprotein diacylglycerol transferase
VTISPYALALLSGILIATFAVHLPARRFGLSRSDVWVLSALFIAVAFVGGHWFDVIFYQSDEAARRPALWLMFHQGHSLFGALLSMAIAFAIWAQARRLDMAIYADVFAAGLLVAMVGGRIGCALVHDHPGLPTDLPFGVDFPPWQVQWAYDTPTAEPMRLHDLGLEELVLLIPIAIATWVLVYRRLRAGTAAAFAGIAYACVRFGLDFLRAPKTEPKFAGLTVGQWSCAVLLLGCISAARHIARHGRVAPLAGEPPPPELPTATVQT